MSASRILFGVAGTLAITLAAGCNQAPSAPLAPSPVGMVSDTAVDQPNDTSTYSVLARNDNGRQGDRRQSNSRQDDRDRGNRDRVHQQDNRDRDHRDRDHRDRDHRDNVHQQGGRHDDGRFHARSWHQQHRYGRNNWWGASNWYGYGGAPSWWFTQNYVANRYLLLNGLYYPYFAYGNSYYPDYSSPYAYNNYSFIPYYANQPTIDRSRVAFSPGQVQVVSVNSNQNADQNADQSDQSDQYGYVP